MLSIGDFARLAGVSVRMMRHYDAVGLLRPAHVDPHSGYRSYTAAQLDRANRLVAFKQLGFTLEQVSTLLEDEVDVEQMRGMLRLRRTELATRIATDQGRLEQVEHRLRMIERKTMSSTTYEETSLPALRLAQFTARVGDQSQVGEVVGPLFGRLDGAVAAAGLTPTGPSMGHYSFDDNGLVAAAAYPVETSVTEADVAGTDLEVADLPAQERAVTTRMTGSLNGIGEAWQALTREVERRGLRFAGPCREIYVQASVDDPDNWVIDLQQPVA